ncbi:hypothetical protein BKK54_04735 [Rodentibacter genomosp. 1]|uniref:Uncharacterized protein n=1 Tax=Rodentibacter genomosp. 1 TaxID=1908264 RepID=A0A1V3J7X0_9PAST|nr:hypothetical protein [Rodentibacter genomosp. 1]OOF51003.1 hypothetical protein BKK54_04735 [Rodentibacter genomosp. 1]
MAKLIINLGVKLKPEKMEKRNLFNELKQGFDQIQAHQKGEIELPSYTPQSPEPAEIEASKNND